MPARNVETKTGGYCKIRKRVSSNSSATCSSSSTTTLVKNYRLKRPVLVAKRPGSTTPIPIWKMASRSPSVFDKGKEAQISARRLAATLWENNGGGDEEKENSNSPLCKDGSKQASRHRRRTSHKLEVIEYVGQPKDSSVRHFTTSLKDVHTSLTASKELVKVLLKMWSQEEQNSSNITLVSALKVEIDRARHQAERLMHEKRYNQKEVDALLKHFGSEKAAWKSKEQERISNAVSSIARELEVEKKLRRQTERLNKTLGRELADTKAELNKAMEELVCERRAREILEKTCDELATGLGEDRCDEVEKLKRECEMLQVADVLREERVQMKLADARYEYEEKNAALERLRNDLEGYLGGGGGDSGGSERHSIELSMDNMEKSYKWSFGNEDSRRASVDEMFKGRRSLNEKIQWESICLQRKTSQTIELDFTMTNNNSNTKASSLKGRQDQVLLLSSEGGEGCSRPESPPEDRDSKAVSVHSGDFFRGT